MRRNPGLPAQALAELANVALKKLKPPMGAEPLRAQIERLARMFSVLPLTQDVILEAVRGVQDHGLAYYDAQIWAVARIHRITTILSEDFNPGAVIEGVGFINPLAPAFTIEDLR